MGKGINIFEQLGVISCIVPLDLQTARDGDWISMKLTGDLNVIVFKAAGTAGDDPDISFEQAKDVAGTDSKALNAIADIWKQQGTLTTTGNAFTRVTQTADDLYDADGTSAESQAIYGFYIRAELLDMANGFDCVRVRIADTGTNAQLGCALAIPANPRYQPTPNAVID